MHLCISTIFFVVAILLFLSKFAIFALRVILFSAIFVLSINTISDFFEKDEFFRCDKSMLDSILLYRKDTRTIIFCFLDRKRKHYLMREITLNRKFVFFLSRLIVDLIFDLNFGIKSNCQEIK